MEIANIITLLNNSGLKVIGTEGDFIVFQDPSCLFNAFDMFMNYAWAAVIGLLIIMLIGWGLLYLYNGAKLESIFKDTKALFLMFTVLALVKPIVNAVYGDNLFAKQCETKRVSLTQVKKLLAQRDTSLDALDDYLMQETFTVVDSGIIYDTDTNLIPENIEITTETNTTNTTSIQSPRFESVEYTKNSTTYITADGEKIVRSGGSVAWRNNNPGNLKATTSSFTMNNGAIGSAGQWAVFPDEQTGLKAITKLLRTKRYNNLSISAAIHRYAPFSDNNNPIAYSNRISKLTGLSSDLIIDDLSDDDLIKVARAIQVVEGWIPGTEQKQ